MHQGRCNANEAPVFVLLDGAEHTPCSLDCCCVSASLCFHLLIFAVNMGVAMKRTMAMLLSILLQSYGSILADKSTDMLSLQDFSKAITHDPNGTLNSWNSSTDHCLWEGIICSHRHLGRVVALNLTAQGVAGNISPSLGNLTFLKTVDLSANSFSGQLPSLNRLHKLQSLVLSENMLDGIIPNSLTNCSNFRVIDLSRNSLVGEIPQRLDALSHL
ncbi:hypothetical protein ACQ4PT_018189 [Festuca glaucescens]